MFECFWMHKFAVRRAYGAPLEGVTVRHVGGFGAIVAQALREQTLPRPLKGDWI
jgi:hypothetical protein